MRLILQRRASTMTSYLSKDPLHGFTLEQLLNKLVESYG
ncbi:VF530 family DNA-binding protein [Serratia symbiotica]|nr:VF530 family DNA-binding protein [Serratia symbiotica]